MFSQFTQTAQKLRKDVIVVAITTFEEKQSKLFQLTINNPETHGWSHDQIKKTILHNFKTFLYFCMADEEGSCYHTHVFVCFSSRVRVKKVMKHFPNIHIEIVKGKVSDNIDYIRKSGKWENDKKQETVIEGTFEEYGARPPDNSGKSVNLAELYRQIEEGASNGEIISRNTDYIMQIDKLDKIRNTILTEQYKERLRLDIEVVYISGATGSGKTKGVFEKNGYSDVYRVTDYSHPFDGYSSQNVLFLDEYRSSLPLKDMLIYLDIYPTELPSRYSNKVACYNRVYIVSNWELERQYQELQKTDQESWKAFLRRIHQVWTYDKNGNVTKYNSVKEYFDREEEFMEVDENEEGQLPFNK